VRGEVPEPEGMPSVYRPWLRYRERGYDVHVLIDSPFGRKRTLDFHGCSLHVVPRSRFFRWTAANKRFRLGFLGRTISLYRAAVATGRSCPPAIIYALDPWLSPLAWGLSKRWRSTSVKRVYGTSLYAKWFHNEQQDEWGKRPTRYKLVLKLRCLPHFLAWLWPSDLMIITNDGTEGDKLADFLRIDKRKYRMWINGVDNPPPMSRQRVVAARQRLGLTAEEFVVLCLSRLAKWKRQDRAILAMRHVVNQIPNARLLIVGDGAERATLQALVERLALKEHVLFLGMISHSRVPDIMAVADVFLQTNDLSCLGNTLLEALASGKTIVTWDVGVTSDVIADGSTGRLLPDAEPETIARTLVSLAQNPEERQRLAEGARLFAEQHLQTWNERLDMEIDLVESIARGSARPRPCKDL